MMVGVKLYQCFKNCMKEISMQSPVFSDFSQLIGGKKKQDGQSMAQGFYVDLRFVSCSSHYAHYPKISRIIACYFVAAKTLQL